MRRSKRTSVNSALLLYAPFEVNILILLGLVRVAGWIGGLLACMAFKNELVDGDERVQLTFRSGVGSRSVRDASATHRAPAHRPKPLTARSRDGLFPQTQGSSLRVAGR